MNNHTKHSPTTNTFIQSLPVISALTATTAAAAALYYYLYQYKPSSSLSQSNPPSNTSTHDKSAATTTSPNEPRSIVGLRNLGNTCFLNSILQSLNSLHSFGTYLDKIQLLQQHSINQVRLNNTSSIINHNNNNNNNSEDLVSEFKYCYSGRSPSNISRLYRILLLDMEKFRGYQEQDAHEFYVSCVQVLEKTVKQAVNNAKNIGISNNNHNGGNSGTKYSWEEIDNLADQRERDGNSDKQDEQDDENKESLSSSADPVPTSTPLPVTDSSSIFPAIPRDPFQGLLANFLRCTSCSYSSPVTLTSFNAISLTIPFTQSHSRNNKPLHLLDCLSQYCESELVSEVKCACCSSQQFAYTIQRQIQNLVNTGEVNEVKKKGKKKKSNSSSKSVDKSVPEQVEELNKQLTAIQHAIKKLVPGAALMDANSMSTRATTTNTNPTPNNTTHSATALTHLSTSTPLIRSNISLDSDPSLSELDLSALHSQFVRRQFRKKILFARLPSVLCFHVNRLFGDMKLNQWMQFPLLLDMTQWSASSNLGQNQSHNGSENYKSQLQYDPLAVYSLCSVVVHHGGADSGHYTCYRKKHTSTDSTQFQNPVDSKWVHLSDESMSETSIERVLKCEAYMLFYEKVPQQSEQSQKSQSHAQ